LLLEVTVVVVIEVRSVSHEGVFLGEVNPVCFHHADQHIVSEVHGRRGFAVFCIAVVVRIAVLRRHFFVTLSGCCGLVFSLCSIERFGGGFRIRIGFDFIAEVNTVEPVQGFSIDHAAALDVKGDLETLAFGHLWHMPHEVETTLALL